MYQYYTHRHHHYLRIIKKAKVNQVRIRFLRNDSKKNLVLIGGESGGGGGGIRMTPLSYLANNNATFSTIRSHHRPNNNSTCTTDNSIITI
jgi:hypothetical protein